MKKISVLWKEFRIAHHDCDLNFVRTGSYTEQAGKDNECHAIHQVTQGHCGICGKQLSID